VLISCEENNGAGKGWVREMMVWRRGGGGNFFRVEGQVREHSLLSSRTGHYCWPSDQRNQCWCCCWWWWWWQ